MQPQQPFDHYTPADFRALCERAGGQRAAARLLRMPDDDARRLRRWCADGASVPWAVADRLRLHLEGVAPCDSRDDATA